MFRVAFRLFLSSIFIFSAHLSFAKVIHIPQDFQTISAGIAFAAEGDTVLVAPGTYEEQIDFMGKAITVASLYFVSHDHFYIEQTIITHSHFPMVRFDSGETRASILVGFTLTQANVAIYCNHNSSPTLQKLNISDNIANFIGAGILCEKSSNPIMINCTFANNYLVEPTVHGGAIIATSNSHPVIVNSIVWGNIYPQISLWRWGDEQPSSITIAYCDIEGGEQNIELFDGTVHWLQGNIVADPLFVNFDNSDYTLQAESPCKDKGSALFVFENDTLINMDSSQFSGAGPDMGAFEFGAFSDIRIRDTAKLQDYLLLQNYPNPFNPTTTFKYYLNMPDMVKLKIYNLVGQEIATLVHEYQTPGQHEIKWTASGLPSGIYLYKLEIGNFSQTKKLVLQN